MKNSKRKNLNIKKQKKFHTLNGLVLALFQTSRGRFLLSIAAFFSLSAAFFEEHLAAATIIAVTQAVIVRVTSGVIFGGLKEGVSSHYGDLKTLLGSIDRKVSSRKGLISRRTANKKRALYARKKPKVKLVVMEFDE